MESLKNLRSKARSMEALLRIGKNGVTPGIIAELEILLKKRNLVKLKFLPGFLDEKKDRKAEAKLLADKLHAALVDQIGNVVVIYRK